jgi:hypothetical protein
LRLAACGCACGCNPSPKQPLDWSSPTPDCTRNPNRPTPPLPAHGCISPAGRLTGPANEPAPYAADCHAAGRLSGPAQPRAQAGWGEADVMYAACTQWQHCLGDYVSGVERSGGNCCLPPVSSCREPGVKAQLKHRDAVAYWEDAHGKKWASSGTENQGARKKSVTRSGQFHGHGCTHYHHHTHTGAHRCTPFSPVSSLTAIDCAAEGLVETPPTHPPCRAVLLLRLPLAAEYQGVRVGLQPSRQQQSTCT